MLERCIYIIIMAIVCTITIIILYTHALSSSISEFCVHSMTKTMITLLFGTKSGSLNWEVYMLQDVISGFQHFCDLPT